MPQGIDVRATTPRIIFRALLQDGTGGLVTTGTTNLRIYEIQESATPTLNSYDFNDNTFKSTALTTEVLAMTHRTGNNGTTNTGLWTVSLETLTGFTVGRVYLMRVDNTNASPNTQVREFQYGNAEGDLTVTATRLNTNPTAVGGDTNTPTRLTAALTTSNGIDLNMGQATPSSPTADTTGEALRFAHQSLPGQVAADAVGGLPVRKNAGPDVLNFSPDTGSSTTQIIVPAGSMPSGDADNDYRGAVLVIKDVSAGDRINIRPIASSTASTNTLTLSEALGFTPEAGVDLATVYVGTAADILAELLKVTTGFGSTAPNTLQAYIKALVDKTAATPSGLGTFSPATDSVEAIRDLLDLMAGAGFSTGTDSLAAIRDAIDTLVAPNIVSSTALSGSGFLAECVSLIRKAIDEPSVSPKYTDSILVSYIQSAFSDVLADINVNSDHPILVRYTFPLVVGTQVYTLPPNVGQVWRIAKIDATTGVPHYEVWPGNEFSFSGYGFQLEGNQLRFLSKPNLAETLEILYLPVGESYIHKATATAFTTTSITFPTTVTDGTLDTRLQAYAGSMVRILSDANNIIQERIIPSWENSTRVAQVSVAFSPALSGTVVYEVLPYYTQLIKEVVVTKAALRILVNEGSSKKEAAQTRLYQQQVRALRTQLASKNARFPHSMNGNTVDNDMRPGWYGGL